MRSRKTTTGARVLVVALTTVQVLPVSMLALPLAAAEIRMDTQPRSSQASVAEPPAVPRTAAPGRVPPGVSPNRVTPQVSPPSPVPTFSKNPTNAEIFNARVFEEPLVPTGRTSAAENRALAAALTELASRGHAEDVEPFVRFTQDFPYSAWSTSLLVNLGLTYRRTGRFSHAIDAFERAWQLGQRERDPKAKAIADRAVVELADINGRLGRTERVDALLGEINNRGIGGSAGEVLVRVRERQELMKKEPGQSFRCGPLALENIFAFLHGSEPIPSRIRDARATPAGSSLLQMNELADAAGMTFQMARRDPGTALLLPAMVHWKVGHFAAVLERVGQHYRVQDPTFGTEFAVPITTFDKEGSGFLLVPQGTLPQGWHAVPSGVGRTVWGKGQVDGPEGPPPGEPHTPSGPCTAMAAYRLSLLTAGLNIYDGPVGYAPPVGPAVTFRVDYNQRDSYQPSNFSYSNLGPKWTFGWLSYVLEDDASNATVKLYAKGGGQSTYTGLAGNTSAVHPRDQTILARTSTTPIRYERRLNDGSLEVFTAATGAPPSRKVFLTQMIDPQGNTLTFTYDPTMRLIAATDAIGQVTEVLYENAADPLKITRVRDPFGRFATFEYDRDGRLSRIVDVIGIASDFTYGTGADVDFITSMTTPYGLTTFTTFIQSNSLEPRWIQATDPMGGRERVAFSEAVEYEGDERDCQPSGFPANSQLISWRNTYYWNRRAMAQLGPLGPRIEPQGRPDLKLAHIYHWVHGRPNVLLAAPILESERLPLESRVYYAYAGQNWTYPPPPGGPGASTQQEGTSSQPLGVSRALITPGTPCTGGNPAQLYLYGYNAVGKVVNTIDPIGRETHYVYGNNNVDDPDPGTAGTGLDLLKIKQKIGTDASGAPLYATLSTMTYDTKHRALSITDAAGQTTAYTYNTAGQVLTVTTPARAGISEDRTTTYDYDSSGYLQNVTRPAAGAVTRYSYDGYGRIAAITETDGYTLAYEYDALDRPTRVTYPDGTYEETVYDRLDVTKRRDRLGRLSHTVYDAMRRPTLFTDAAGRTTRQQWCACGSLDKMIDPNGNTTTWTRDLQGRVLSETRADGKAWSYNYEFATSRLQYRLDPKQQLTTYEYFADDKLKQVSYSGAVVPTPTVNYTYDTIYDRVATRQSGTETPTVFAYHAITPTPVLGAGQLATVDGPLTNDTVSYTYDELGRIASRGLVGPPAFMTSFNYDALGRVAAEVTPVGTFTYSYEGTTTRPLSLTYPNSQATQYTYFADAGDHRLQRIKHLAPAGTTISQYDYTYNAVGDILTWTQQVGTGTPKIYSYEYDSADQLVSAKHIGTPPLPTPARYAYAYDPAGNRIAEQQDNNVVGATYNSRNQLVSRQPGGALLFRGTLNEPGTVAVQNTPAQVAPNNSFVAQAPVPAAAGNITVVAKDYSNNTRTNLYQVQANTGSTANYTYDFNGNLTSDGTKTYEWDADNRLVAVKQGVTVLVTFTYDAFGRRSQKTSAGATTTAVYDRSEVIESRPSSGGVTRFVHGPSVDRHWATVDPSGTSSYLLADHLGSVVQVTAAPGTVSLSRDYEPYGLPLLSIGTSGYAYTGREWDAESALYHYRARIYAPTLGRFISEDPAGSIDGPNLYSYTKGNPLRYTDPSGLRACIKFPSSGNVYCSPPTPNITACLINGTCTSVPDPDEPTDAQRKACFDRCMGYFNPLSVGVAGSVGTGVGTMAPAMSTPLGAIPAMGGAAAAGAAGAVVSVGVGAWFLGLIPGCYLACGTRCAY